MLKALLRLRAWIERSLAPNLSWCYRCRRPWNRVKGHMTPYDEDRRCFPLCEACWSKLTPDERLPFYRELWKSWSGDVPWAVMHAACMDEGAPEVPSQVILAWKDVRTTPAEGTLLERLRDEACFCTHGELASDLFTESADALNVRDTEIAELKDELERQKSRGVPRI